MQLSYILKPDGKHSSLCNFCLKKGLLTPARLLGLFSIRNTAISGYVYHTSASAFV